jgi:hypothetical protein
MALPGLCSQTDNLRQDKQTPSRKFRSYGSNLLRWSRKTIRETDFNRKGNSSASIPVLVNTSTEQYKLMTTYVELKMPQQNVNSCLSPQGYVWVIREKCTEIFWITTFGKTDRHTAQEFVSFHGDDDSYCGLVVYDTTYPGRWVPTFRRNLVRLWGRNKWQQCASPKRRYLKTTWRHNTEDHNTKDVQILSIHVLSLT